MDIEAQRERNTIKVGCLGAFITSLICLTGTMITLLLNNPTRISNPLHPYMSNLIPPNQLLLGYDTPGETETYNLSGNAAITCFGAPSYTNNPPSIRTTIRPGSSFNPNTGELYLSPTSDKGEIDVLNAYGVTDNKIGTTTTTFETELPLLSTSGGILPVTIVADRSQVPTYGSINVDVHTVDTKLYCLDVYD